MNVNPTTTPIVSEQLTAQSICFGTSFSPLSISTLGTNITYQWYSNTTASNTGGTIISGATTSTYTPNASSVGTSYYYCIVNTTCGNQTSTVSGAQIVIANPIVTLPTDKTICKGTDISLVINGTSNTQLNYTLNGSSSQLLIGSTVNEIITLTNILADQTIVFSTIQTTTTPVCSTTINQTIVVNVVDYPSAPVTSADVTYCEGEIPAQLSATALSGNILVWYSDINLTDSIGSGSTYNPLLQTSTYYVTQTNSTGCESNTSIINVVFNKCSIVTPSAFTPDGDKVNDTWKLEFIDLIYPKNKVKIYNRWGNIVFESEEGKYESNPWDGKLDGQELPVASYYYSIDYNDGKTKTEGGIVTIIRE